MSVEAITWALKEPVEHSSAKFVLVVLANCASSESFEAYPSVKHLSEATGQDRKTVLANLKRLIESGHIADTGKRIGQTGQVVVYRLNSTKNGTVKESQKRNSTENGTVPNFPSKSTVFPSKESQISHERVPKTGHGTVIEPSLTVNETIEVAKAPKAQRLKLETIPEDWYNFCRSERPDLDPKNVFDSFKDFWISKPKDNTRLDWFATWRNWVRNQWSNQKPAASNRHERQMKTLSGLTGGIHGNTEDAQFKPITETIDMEASHARLPG